jgi:ParB family chromosome partitioning protein
MSSSPKGGLGRGLSALIPQGASTLEEVSPASIRPNPRQPRQNFGDEALSELAASIRQVGLLQPVVVRRTSEGGLELVVGERRWRAAQRAGMNSIPAIVVETDDRGSLERALIENLHRQDLNAIEEAAAFQQLLDEAGLTHDQLAEKVGLSRPGVSNSLRLLELPPGIQAMVIDGRLSAGHARAILSLAGHPLLERTAQQVAAEGLSVRETEDLVREIRESTGATSEPTRRPRSPVAPGLVELSEKLSDLLETRVQVTMGKRKGRVTIEFATVQDLDRIYQRIAGDRSIDLAEEAEALSFMPEEGNSEMA